MVACINILYWKNRATAADGSAVSCSLRFSAHLESICSESQNFQWKILFCKSTPNGLKRVKNMKPPTRPPPPSPTADAAADRFPQ